MSTSDDSSTAAPTTTAPPKAPRRIGLFAVVALLAFLADLISKLIVVAELPLEPSNAEPTRILWGLFYFDQVRNSGAAFSLGTGFTVILTVVAVGVVGVIVRTASRMRSKGWAIALGLVLGGAIGNLVDRIFRAPSVFRGHVVDWISVFGPRGEHWPIFNLADSAIVCGAILAGLLSLRGVEFDSSSHPARSDD